MNKPKKKELKVIWKEVEDLDFDEHLRRVFETIMREEPATKTRSGDPNSAAPRGATQREPSPGI